MKPSKIQNIIVDLSYIHSDQKMKESVALYAFRFLQNLSTDQRKNLTLLVTKKQKDSILSITGEYSTIEFRDLPNWQLKIPYLKGLLRYFNWKKQIKKIQADCIYIPFSWSGNSGKVNIKKVITIHDLRPMREADRIFANSKLFRVLNLKKLYLSGSRYFYTKHIKNASKVIAISNYIGDELKSEWPDYSNKITTIYNSVTVSPLTPLKPTANSEFFDKRFLLYVNTITPYKNLITLVKSFQNLCKFSPHFDYNLVIVGKLTEYWEEEILPYIKINNLESKILRVNFAKDEELRWLYEHASLFVSTSLHEGFGYTPIEATICNCPVLTTKCDSLPDVTAGRVFYYDPPESVNDLSRKIDQILSNEINEDEIRKISKFFSKRYDIRNQCDQILDKLYNG